jgi:hypothetical protein
MTTSHHFTRGDLVRIATQAMSERGLEPEFPVRVKLVSTSVERGFIDFVHAGA